MKPVVVLDASAILAFLQSEPGSEKLADELLDRSVASTVNLAEVQGRLVANGFSPDEAWELATSVARESEMFTGQQAKLAGDLIRHTAKAGLSLGDRACLALGMTLKAEIYTADRTWSKLKLSVPLQVIR